MDYFVPNETMRPLTIPQEMLLTNHPLIGYRCFNPTETTLLPNTVNLIDTGFTINFPPGYIIKLEPFSNSSPYKLLNHYIFPNQTKNNNLIIPLITTEHFLTPFLKILYFATCELFLLQMWLLSNIMVRIKKAFFKNCQYLY